MNQTTTQVNPTTKFFNNIYSPIEGVSQTINDAIYGYFETLTQDKESAKILTSVVIDTAKQQNLDPLAVLEDFKKLPDTDLYAYLALFLNLSRVPTSLLGVKVAPTINPFIARTVLF